MALNSHELRQVVDDWRGSDLVRSGQAELVFVASGYDHNFTPATGEFPFLGIAQRHAVVWYVGGASMGEYVVAAIDDGPGTGLRSWTVAGDLVEDHSESHYYVIPGETPDDDVVVPYPGAPVVGGIGDTVLEMPLETMLYGA